MRMGYLNPSYFLSLLPLLHPPSPPPNTSSPCVRDRWWTAIWASHKWQALRLVSRCHLVGNVKALPCPGQVTPTRTAKTCPGRRSFQRVTLLGGSREARAAQESRRTFFGLFQKGSLRPWSTRLFCMSSFWGRWGSWGYKWCIEQEKNLVLETNRLWSPYKGLNHLKG